MKTVTEGTSVKIAATIRDESGVPVIPTDFAIWAKNSGYSKRPVMIEGHVVDGILVGFFVPPDPGVWNVGVEVFEPVVVTQNQTLLVAEFSART